MATKEYNVDLDIKGKVSATSVPNSTGSIVTWNSSTNVFGLRTNAQIIADLGLATQAWSNTQGWITMASVGNGNISYTGTGSITGGGTSTANQAGNTNFTFDLTAGTKIDISNGVTAFSWGNHSLAGYLTAANLTGYVPYTGATGAVNLNQQRFQNAVSVEVTNNTMTYPNATNSNADAWNRVIKNYISVTSGNNMLAFIGDSTQNSRRFGLQVGHSNPAFASTQGVLELQPLHGNVLVGSLKGGGTQMVVADNLGILSTQAIPTQITPNDGLLTISTSSDLTGGGTFSADQATASNVAIGLSASTLASLALANTAVQPSALSNYYQSGDVNIPILGGDYRVFPRATSGSNIFDLDTITESGFYYQRSSNTNPNSPKNGYWYIENHRYISGSNDNLTQYAHPYRVQDGKWMRNRFQGTWSPWVEFIHSGNLATYANTLLTGFVPTTRTITINGTTLDLSQNRTWNIPTPAQVNIIQGAGISVTGTYPDLTITNTAPNATHTGDVTGATALTIATNAVTNSKMAQMPTMTIKGNASVGTADPVDLTPSQVLTMLGVQAGANNYTHPNHTGDVTSVGDGATTIVANAVTFTKMQNIATQTFLGRATAGTGNVEALTVAQMQTLLGFSTQTLGNSTSNLIVSNTVERAALTGDVTAPQNSNATTIANGVVTNAKMANMAANTFKGRLSTAGAPQNLTVAQMQTALGFTAPNNGTFTVQGTGSLTGSGSTSANASANTSVTLDLTTATKNDINAGKNAGIQITSLFADAMEYFIYHDMSGGGFVDTNEAFFNLVNPKTVSGLAIDISDHTVNGARLVLQGVTGVGGIVTYKGKFTMRNHTPLSTLVIEGQIDQEFVWDVNVSRWREVF